MPEGLPKERNTERPDADAVETLKLLQLENVVRTSDSDLIPKPSEFVDEYHRLHNSLTELEREHPEWEERILEIMETPYHEDSIYIAEGKIIRGLDAALHAIVVGEEQLAVRALPRKR